MKIQRKWKPGGRPRRRNATKQWILKQQELYDSKDLERFFNERPLCCQSDSKRGRSLCLR